MELIHQVTCVTETWGRQGERSRARWTKLAGKRPSILATNPECCRLTCFRAPLPQQRLPLLAQSGHRRTAGRGMYLRFADSALVRAGRGVAKPQRSNFVTTASLLMRAAGGRIAILGPRFVKRGLRMICSLKTLLQRGFLMSAMAVASLLTSIGAEASS